MIPGGLAESRAIFQGLHKRHGFRLSVVPTRVVRYGNVKSEKGRTVKRIIDKCIILVIFFIK